MAVSTSEADIGRMRSEDTTTSQGLADLCVRIGRLAFVSILTLVPLIFFPSHDLFNLPKVLALHWLTVIAVAAGMVHTLVTRRLRIAGTPLDLPVLLFLAASALATVQSAAIAPSLYGNSLRHDGLLIIVNYAVVCYLAANILTSRAQVRMALEMLVIAGAISAFVGTTQFLGLGLLTLPSGSFSYRAFSTNGNPDFLGTYLVMVLPVAVGLALASSRHAARLLWSAAAVLVAVGLIFTFTRGAWIGAIAGMLVLAALARHQLWAHRRWVGACVVLVAVAAIGLDQAPRLARPTGAQDDGRAAMLPPSIGQVAASLSNVQEGSAGVRLALWRGGMELLRDHPVFGVGPGGLQGAFSRYVPLEFARTEGRFNYADKAHNEFLDVALSSGLVGLAAYLWLQIAMALLIWRALRGGVAGKQRRTLLVALTAALVGFDVQAFFIFTVIETGTLFWALLGITLVVCKATKPRVHHTLALPRVAVAAGSLAIIAVAGLLLFVVAKPTIAGLYSLQAQLAAASVQQGGMAADDTAAGIDRALMLQTTAINWFPEGEQYYVVYARMLRDRARSVPDPVKRREDLDEAVWAYSRAIALNPQFTPYYEQRAQTYESYGEDHTADALSDLRRAVSLYPRSYGANMALAELLRRLNRLPEAIAAERMALQVFPSDARALFALGQDYFQLGRVDEALNEWQGLAKLDPQNASLHYWLGRAESSKGNREAAIREYERALAIDPKLDQASQALQALREP